MRSALTGASIIPAAATGGKAGNSLCNFLLVISGASVKRKRHLGLKDKSQSPDWRIQESRFS